MSLFSKVTSSLLVFLIAATTSVLLLFSHGAVLRQSVEQYPAGGTSLHLFGIPEDRSSSVLSVFGEFTQVRGTAVVRVDRELSNVDGSLTGLRIGVATDPGRPAPALDFGFLGTTFFDAPALSRLLAADAEKSLGLDANAADVLSDIPELAFAPRIVVVQLPRLVETSGTINGEYRVVGADADRLPTLLASLEAATGRSADDLTSSLRGEQTDAGLAELILTGLLLAAALLLLLLLVFETLRAARTLGVHLLVGRSKCGYTLALFAPVLLWVVLAVPLSMVLTVVLARGFDLTGPLLAAAGSSAAAGAAIVLLCVAAAAAVLLSIRPVDAIRGRSSKKLLLGVLAFFYVSSVAGFSLAFAALDGPLDEAGELAEVKSAWTGFAGQQILHRQIAGEDAASFSGRSSRHTQDFYDWYASISEEPGVGLVNTVHYGADVLDHWRGVYSSVPHAPFWYMAASPGYLASQGFEVADGLVARAKAGERVFLLPGTSTAAESEAMKAWLEENSRVDYEASVRTHYLDHPKVGFEEYRPETPLFLWNTDRALPQRATDPVILLLTPQNMIPFESESLAAVGLENSYVKLSAEAAEAFTSPHYLSRFGLDDNDPRFLPVSEFIAGLTKSIQEFLSLFGGVALFLSALCLIMLATVLRLFATIHREALAVKRLLGHSLARVFAPLIITVGAVGALAIAVTVAARSTSGTLANVAMLVLQGLLLVWLVRRHSRLQLASALREQDPA